MRERERDREYKREIHRGKPKRRVLKKSWKRQRVRLKQNKTEK